MSYEAKMLEKLKMPYSLNGKDDLWNGIGLCHLHHWAFDVGWFTLKDNFEILLSNRFQNLPSDFGKMNGYDFLGQLSNENLMISLPLNTAIHPHRNAIKWHRENIFHH